MRVDSYLYHVRIFKTRGLSTQACDRSQVKLLGQTVKPARILKLGDVLEVQRGDLALTLKVQGFPPRRLSAADVETYMENLTPVENFIKAAEARREKILLAPHEEAAKPDKKQLRQIRAWMEANQDL
jgi:ribosome-associated heat shock protein Hsp15